MDNININVLIENIDVSLTPIPPNILQKISPKIIIKGLWNFFLHFPGYKGYQIHKSYFGLKINNNNNKNV